MLCISLHDMSIYQSLDSVNQWKGIPAHSQNKGDSILVTKNIKSSDLNLHNCSDFASIFVFLALGPPHTWHFGPSKQKGLDILKRLKAVWGTKRVYLIASFKTTLSGA